MTELGAKIIKLHNEGKSYNEICDLLGCSKSTISYWCNSDVQKATKRRFHDRRNKIVKLVQKIKSKTPCAECGKKYPYYVMQFDHLPQYEKKFTIGNARGNAMSIHKVEEEIKKCDIVCANCHTIRTWRRKNGGLS